jgi:DNA-binding LytR/AlgR family response regulator
MSGLELARTLRNLRPGLPVVLATGYAQWGARAEDEDFTFIAKPYRREALIAALRTAFERREVWRPVEAPGVKKTVKT